jgi:RimJ/RimL family protein N-acetyltransferase
MIKAAYNLADGSAITIRTVDAADAENLISLKKGYIAGTKSIPLYDFEYKNTTEQERDYILKFVNEENSTMMVAEHEGSLIGNIDITGNQRKKLFHTGMLGMGISYDWQNRKIGSLLMENVLKWALEDSPLKIIWLEAYADNIAGIKLYEKFGFEHCGIIKAFFNEGSPVDKITMVKHLPL